MNNPFKEILHSTDDDAQLVETAISGDTGALESLILRHQSWIYNIAISMTGDPDLAQDITQEVLIKIITKLSTYDSRKASLRTWLYRIVINHTLNMKENRNEKLFQRMYGKFDSNEYIADLPDTRKSTRPEYAYMKNETRFYCILCMLLCLKRMERIVFILGILFDVTDSIGAEICDITKSNYRKILSRSRKKIYEFFHENCGLLDENNPCRCEDQAERMLNAGIIKNIPLSAGDSLGTVADIVDHSIRDMEDSYYEFVALLKSQPFLKGPDMIRWFRDLLERNEFKMIFTAH